MADIWAQIRQQAQGDPPPGVFAPMPDVAPVLPPTQEPTVTLDQNPMHQQIGNDQNQLQKVRWNQSHPWGTAENHPGTAGKIAHVLSVAGNIAGNIFAPSTMALIPGTQLNMQEREGGLAKRLNEEVNDEAAETKSAADTAHVQAETETLKNPPDKFAPLPTESGYQAFNPREGTVTALKDAEGRPLQPFSPAKTRTIDEMAYDSLVQQHKTPLEALDTVYGAKNTKVEDLPHLYLDALQAGDTAKAALIKKAHEDTQVKPTQPPGVTMIVPDGKGGGTVERLMPGQTVAPGAQTAAGVSSMNTPTTNQRTAAGRADTVIQMTPEVLSRIDAVGPKLGSLAGRWNDFMQGKVGSDDPDFAALRSDLLMMSSAVALAHAQGRLPENLREEFDRAINAPHQTAANLKATIQTMIPWLQQVQRQGQRPGEAQPGGASTNSAPKEGDTKVNGAGIPVRFSGGKWGPA